MGVRVVTLLDDRLQRAECKGLLSHVLQLLDTQLHQYSGNLQVM